MKNNNVLNYLIIGAGPVGLYAGNKLKSKKKSFLIVEKRNNIGGQPIILYPEKEIENIPKIKRITSRQLTENWSKKVKRDILRSISIVKINKCDDNFEVLLDNMPRIYVKKILFCTGLGILTPTPLEIPGIKNNVLYDINDIDVFENKNVIVLGGGDSAVDYAIQISKIAKRVVLTHRREEMRISPQKKKTLANSKVVVLLNKTPIKIKNNEAIVLKDNVVGSIESIPFDFVVVQYGHKVESNKYTYLCKLKLENGKIIVNTKQMTNIENIYACGDCCSYKNKQLTIAAGMKEVDKVLS